MHISAIVCKSSVEGYIFVNGFSMGPCTKESSISIPWDGHTPLFINYTPNGGNYLPTSLAFTTLDSLPVCENIILTLWTGVVEVEFKPRKSIAYPPPLLPDELKKVSFTQNNTVYTVSLIEYCGIWTILETDERTLLCEYLGDKSDKYDMKIQFDNPILVHVMASETHWIISYDDDKFVINEIGQYDCKDIGNMLSFTSNEDYSPFTIDYQKDSDDIKISKYIKSHDYKSPKDIAIDMLSSLMVKDTDYAYSLLSTSLQRAFTPQQIIDYIGEIDHIGEAKYQRNSDETMLAVFSKKTYNVYDAQPFVFEFDTMNKIKNITPI